MKHIHFIGIGGIGVSALAKYYLAKEYKVSGCDLNRSEIIDQLQKLGVKIRIGNPQPACSKHADLVVFSPAVSRTNPELKGKKALSYPEALGELTKTHYTIAVSGSHGKSTTTAMLGILLSKAGLDPTVIVGTKLKEFGNSNCRVGKSKYLVIEADEHFASFLNYRPAMIVLTTVESDHLDFYKTLSNIIKTFRKYLALLPKEGIVIANADDPNTSAMIKSMPYRIEKYTTKQKEASKLRKLLKVPGEHNVANALAALTAARVLGIKDKTSFVSLSQFKGSWRRFEIFKLKTANHKPYTLVSDYGHHPTKIRVTVEGARSKWPKKKIWLVYQPHQYARTYYLFKDFVKVLSQLAIEKLILTDIFDVAGREEGNIRKKVSSKKLFEAIQKTKRKDLDVLYIPSTPPFQAIEKYLVRHIKGGEIVMVMGAGNIYSLTLQLTKHSSKEKMK